MTSADSPTKVAIIGGGCAGLTAAFELTRPEHQGRFDVTVYQMGWRLGGKGASGRGVHGRIEEHGLHLWMGYYENAFRLMRECYAELPNAPPLGSVLRFEDAFLPANELGAMDWSPRGAWVPWKVDFPAMPGLPGDANPPRLTVNDYMMHASRLLRALFSTLLGSGRTGPSTERIRKSAPDDVAYAIGRLAAHGPAAGLAAMAEAVSWLELMISGLSSYPQALVSRLLDVILEQTRTELAKVTRDNDEARRILEVAELVLASIRGSIRFRLAADPRGFDAIDDYDCRQWLKMNGASDAALNSAFIRSLYDLAFAYAGGDPHKPAIAAGSAIRGAFRAFFTYRGAFFWKMSAGMGDIVFAPLYRVLHRRGVRFEFFHKLTSVGLSSSSLEAPHVATLDFDVQARTAGGGEYRPLCIVKDLACWPACPDYAQLAGGHELAARDVDFESQWDDRCDHRRTIRVGADFDFVVLATGIDVTKTVCAQIIERDEHWQRMVENVKSVPTQVFQLWFEESFAELGWSSRPVNVSGFVEPFDTCADMSHVAAREEWSPKGIAYFCSVLPDETPRCHSADEAATFVAKAKERVRASSVDFLNGAIGALWPGAVDTSGHFRWDTLLSSGATEGDVSGTPGPERFTTQYWAANVRPTERYTQCLPGSTKHRISPLDRSYDNLTIAGDWTNCSLNMGCVEAAVMSGLLAAHALSGSPELADIVGYDHP